MNAHQMATAYVLGCEQGISSNGIIAVLNFKNRINRESLFPIYRKFILENKMLQSKFAEDSTNCGFHWDILNEEELNMLLSKEQTRQSRVYKEEELLQYYEPTNAALPFIIMPIDDYKMGVLINHALANGRAVNKWIERWVRTLLGEKNTEIKEVLPTESIISRLDRRIKRINSYIWLPAYKHYCKLRRKGKFAPEKTLDISRGRYPTPDDEYLCRKYVLSSENYKIMNDCRKRLGLTFTEYFVYVIAKAFLDFYKEAENVNISVPMDIVTYFPYACAESPANMTGSLPVKLCRGEDLRGQVKKAFKWFRRGIPYSLLTAMGKSASYSMIKQFYTQDCGLPINKRGPDNNFSFIISNGGSIRYETLDYALENIWFYFKLHSIFIAAINFSGKQFFTVTLPKGLYGDGKMIDLIDAIFTPEYLCNI